MADELDEFLRQAAERRRERQKQKQAKSGETNSPTKEQRRTERDLPSAEAQHASTSASRSKDEPQARPPIDRSSPAKARKKKERNVYEIPERVAVNQPEVPALVPEVVDTQIPPVNQPQVVSSEILRQLRDPKTLRMAILAQEILRRPYP